MSAFTALTQTCAADEAAPRDKLSPPSSVAVGVAYCSIDLDGRDDEPCWNNAAFYPVNEERFPKTGRTAIVATRYRVLQDGTNLYVFVDCADPSPADLRYFWSRRDELGADQDNVTVYLDPIGKRAFAQFFRVNPVGAITDGTFNESNGQGTRLQDFDFDVRTRVGEQGWTAEFRIPFRSLRYGSSDATGDWSILITRSYPRDQSFEFASVPLSKSSDCFLCRNPLLTGIAFPAESRFLSGAAYALVRRRTGRDDLDAGTAGEAAAGIDVKMRLSPSSFVDLTLNPDFSQVEIDAPQLAANARFGLYYREKRPFFLEGEDLLDTPLNLIYTRAVGDPQAGLRLTQRGDRSEGFALAVQDRGGSAIQYPGTFSSYPIVRASRADVAFARVRRALSPGMTLGGSFSLRRSNDGSNNAVVGSDAVWQANEQNKFRVNAAVSDTRGDARAIAEGKSANLGSGSALFVDHSFYGERFESLLTLERVSPNFRSENGFISQAGYTKASSDVGYRIPGNGFFHQIKPYLSVSQDRSLQGDIVSQTVHPAVQLLGPYGLALLTEAHLDQLRVDEGLRLHTLPQVLVSARVEPGASIARVKVEAEIGRRLDFNSDHSGPGLRLLGEVRVRPSRRTEISVQLNHEQIDGQDGKRVLRDTTWQGLITQTFSIKDWARLIYQGSSTVVGATGAVGRHAVSLVYVTEPISLTNIDVGLTAVRNINTGRVTRSTEAFVKATYFFSLVL